MPLDKKGKRKIHFIHFYRFAVELYHVHNFDGIVSVLLGSEFNETVALVELGGISSSRIPDDRL